MLRLSTTVATGQTKTESYVPAEYRQAKWACPRCTYVNWHKTRRCVQCDCESPIEQRVATPTKNVIQNKSLLTSTNASMQLGGKWRCLICTYENWPKSQFCTMCRTPHATTKEVIDESIVNLRGSSASAVGSVATRPIHPSRRSALTTPFLSTLDRLWLDACKAVADGETAPIEEYLLSGGRLDRKLTKQECRHLERLFGSNRLLDSQALSAASSPDISAMPSAPAAARASSVSPNAATWELRTPTSATALPPSFKAGFTLADLAIQTERAHVFNIPDERRPSPPTVREGDLTDDEHVGLTARHLRPLRSGHPQLKQTPCQASPHVARELRHFLADHMHQRKGHFPCVYLAEWGTFALPAAVGTLPQAVGQLLLSKLCDRQVQQELEDRSRAINWWVVTGQKQSGRLFALWNRTAGDCLLDSVLQACWGIFDRDNSLRQALSESLSACESDFYPRWRDYEAAQAANHYTLEDYQRRRDWENVLTTACQPREALEQFHVFALCHILRRPIIIYGVKYINNYRDEPIGIANFQGIYLPLLWERNFCSRNPIVLGYTRGHFTALVPMQAPDDVARAAFADETHEAGYLESALVAQEDPVLAVDPTADLLPSHEALSPRENESPSNVAHETTTASTLTTTRHSAAGPTSTSSGFVYLPLIDRQGTHLPIHFTTDREAHRQSGLLRDWLDVVPTRHGLPLARLRLHPQHPLVERMLSDWLSMYMRLADIADTTTMTTAASGSGGRNSPPDFSVDDCSFSHS